MHTRFLWSTGSNGKKPVGTTVRELAFAPLAVTCNAISLRDRFENLTLGASGTDVVQGAHAHGTSNHHQPFSLCSNRTFGPANAHPAPIKNEPEDQHMTFGEDEWSTDWPTIWQGRILSPPKGPVITVSKSRGKPNAPPQSRFDVYQLHKKLNGTTASPEETQVFKQRVRTLELDDELLRLVMDHSGNCFESQTMLIDKLEALRAKGVVFSFWRRESAKKVAASDRVNAALEHKFHCTIGNCKKKPSESLQKACQHLTGFHWKLELYQCGKCSTSWPYARNASRHQKYSHCSVGLPLLSKTITPTPQAPGPSSHMTAPSTTVPASTTSRVQSRRPAPAMGAPSGARSSDSLHTQVVGRTSQRSLQIPGGLVDGNSHVHRHRQQQRQVQHQPQPQQPQPQPPRNVDQQPHIPGYNQQWNTSPAQPLRGPTIPFPIPLTYPPHMYYYPHHATADVPVAGPSTGHLCPQGRQAASSGYPSYTTRGPSYGPQTLQPAYATRDIPTHTMAGGTPAADPQSNIRMQPSYHSNQWNTNQWTEQTPFPYNRPFGVPMGQQQPNITPTSTFQSSPLMGQFPELITSRRGSGRASTLGSSLCQSAEHLPYDSTNPSGYPRFATRSATVEVVDLFCEAIGLCKLVGSFFIAPPRWRYRLLTLLLLANYRPWKAFQQPPMLPYGNKLHYKNFFTISVSQMQAKLASAIKQSHNTLAAIGHSLVIFLFSFECVSIYVHHPVVNRIYMFISIKFLAS
ncbi:hypothetical protein FRB91_011126 [Serendipita sp. 411]|nr:hypothetical protein FRB91_011126 [Serendipita sp. 411]